tara:strand:+ start:81 stop:563 length:483 start_codon:yes stop_codon:yes gene_type:complete
VIIENDYKAIELFLIAFQFKNVKRSETFEVWEQPIKSLTFKVNKNNNYKNCFKYNKNKLQKLILNNFSHNEIREYLKNIVKKKEVRFKKYSHTKILIIEPNLKKDAKSELLESLLPEEIEKNNMNYSTPIEFPESLEKKIKNEFLKQIDIEIKEKIINLK